MPGYSIPISTFTAGVVTGRFAKDLLANGLPAPSRSPKYRKTPYNGLGEDDVWIEYKDALDAGQIATQNAVAAGHVATMMAIPEVIVTHAWDLEPWRNGTVYQLPNTMKFVFAGTVILPPGRQIECVDGAEIAGATGPYLSRLIGTVPGQPLIFCSTGMAAIDMLLANIDPADPGNVASWGSIFDIGSDMDAPSRLERLVLAGGTHAGNIHDAGEFHFDTCRIQDMGAGWIVEGKNAFVDFENVLFRQMPAGFAALAIAAGARLFEMAIRNCKFGTKMTDEGCAVQLQGAADLGEVIVSDCWAGQRVKPIDGFDWRDRRFTFLGGRGFNETRRGAMGFAGNDVATPVTTGVFKRPGDGAPGHLELEDDFSVEYETVGVWPATDLMRTGAAVDSEVWVRAAIDPSSAGDPDITLRLLRNGVPVVGAEVSYTDADKALLTQKIPTGGPLTLGTNDTLHVEMRENKAGDNPVKVNALKLLSER